jgi:hypothetical protein
MLIPGDFIKLHPVLWYLGPIVILLCSVFIECGQLIVVNCITKSSIFKMKYVYSSLSL